MISGAVELLCYSQQICPTTTEAERRELVFLPQVCSLANELHEVDFVVVAHGLPGALFYTVFSDIASSTTPLLTSEKGIVEGIKH